MVGSTTSTIDLNTHTQLRFALVLFAAIAQKEQLGFDKAVEVHRVHLKP